MPLPISLTISANAVAWYAALVSTVLLIIRYLDYRKDRVNVILDCMPDYRVYGATAPHKPDTDYILIKVINKGRRPVTIGNVGFITKGNNEKDALLSDSLREGPRELNEGKSTSYLMEQDAIDLNKIKYFVAYDLTGREFKGKLKRKKNK